MKKGVKKDRPIDSSEIVEQDYKEMNEKLKLNNIQVSQKPKLIISKWCHNHIRNLHIYSPDKEWLALCRIEPVGDGVFKLVDMIHPEQKVSASDCEATDNGMDWAVDFLMEDWQPLWQWNCILHSHHHMSCFWSWTDDNARLGYNDWRTLCWAVVTAYSGKPEDGEISYKSCVNFYKPYNIEIDVDVEIEEGDYYSEMSNYLNYDNEREANIKELAKSIFDEKILEKQEELNEANVMPDYSKLLSYLWIDISRELEENYRNYVQTKLPNKKLQQIYSDVYQEAMSEAEEIIGSEPAVIDDDVVAWKEWSDILIEQLDDHIVKSAFPSAWYNYDYLDTEWEYGKKKKKKKNKWKQEKIFSEKAKENMERTFYYTKDNFPTVESVKYRLGLPVWVNIFANARWVYEGLNPFTHKREPLDDCIQYLYD